MSCWGGFPYGYESPVSTFVVLALVARASLRRHGGLSKGVVDGLRSGIGCGDGEGRLGGNIPLRMTGRSLDVVVFTRLAFPLGKPGIKQRVCVSRGTDGMMVVEVWENVYQPSGNCGGASEGPSWLGVAGRVIESKPEVPWTPQMSTALVANAVLDKSSAKVGLLRVCGHVRHFYFYASQTLANKMPPHSTAASMSPSHFRHTTRCHSMHHRQMLTETL